MRRAALLFVMLMLATPLLASAEDGYVYGDNHCFYFSAPTGWTADHLSGKSQGLAFVFYPADSSWSKATTVIYARVADKSKTVKEPKDQVAQTLEQFHKEYESPNSKAERVTTIKARSGVIGEIYKFTGDKWGNTELVAYFNGKNTINFFVMTARDAKDLENNRKILEELAQSYREGNDCKPCDEPSNTSSCKDNAEISKKLPATLTEAKKLGDQQENADATRDYHRTALMPYFGNKYSGIFKHCFDTISKPDDRAFTFVAAINSDGTVLRVYQDLETNIFQCMNAILIKDHFPKPPVAPYFLSVEMKFTP
ncbi:MAG TPA: hypothetical protein VN604_01820 [Nitrospirota bacterium]|nr:hypothetical protein [Nitrospirota bacterium]